LHFEQTKSLTWKSANSHSVEESDVSFPHLGHLTIVRPYLNANKPKDKIFEEDLKSFALSSLFGDKVLSRPSARDFEKFQDVFAWVRSEDISHYKDIGLQNMETKK